MRHRLGGRKLHRTTSHRLAMLGNLVTSLLEHERVKTTVPKAKEARRMAERIITLGKRGGVANQRLAARTVRSKPVLTKVFTSLKDRYATRPGGYTRIIRLGFRTGDAAPMAFLELIDRPEAPPEGAKEATTATSSAPEKAPKKAKAAKAEASGAEQPKAAQKTAKPKASKAKKAKSE